MTLRSLKKSLPYVLPVFLISISLASTPSLLATKAGPVVPDLEIPAPVVKETEVNVSEKAAMLYDELELQKKGLSEDAFIYAMKGFDKLVKEGKVSNKRLLTVADFTKSSAQKRFFVIDVKNEKVLYHTWVAHGRGSGGEFANSFSNIPESYQSSLGFYVTSGTYNGKNGFSMRLEGLEAGINSNALNRAIVIHGAPYVSQGFINARGYIGRSHGCPALPENLNKPIIETIKDGSLLFIYSTKNNYTERSRILNA